MPLLFLAAVFWILTFLLLPADALAVTIAAQDQNYSASLTAWQAIQELGTDLTGTASAFTFRVSTSRSNTNQFDNTAINSRIYDKSNNNSYAIVGCGLTFNTTNVPSGYEDAILDFSCRNYSFITGHKYLILISNANMGNSGSGQILFAAASYSSSDSDIFPDGGLRYANANPYDYSNNSGSCDPVSYVWNGTNPWGNGCYVWGNSKNDLYFVLTNNAPPPPPPRLPVVFIPGIGGSELKAGQDIFYSNHAYKADEKVWVNQDEAVKLGDDDYFDVLKLKSDGVTPEASLAVTGNLSSFGYGDIDSFFTGMGYVKGNNFFVFNYDWRKDVRTNKDSLDSLIEQAKTASGQSKVNLVVHSMGGLIARYYISDSSKAAKVNKLIELGVPHLGSIDSIKTLMYGVAIKSKVFGLIPLGIAASEMKDVSQNMPSVFQLLPSTQYYNFYNNTTGLPYPYRDDRDIDNDKVTGVLNYSQTKTLLSNLNYNMSVFGIGEQFHTTQDPIFNQTNGIKVYEIVGTAQPTLGQIIETWWVTWPINLISKKDELFINGDDTVPLYSASLKNDSQDLSGAQKIYYVEQKHSDLVFSSGTAMQTVKSLLNDDNTIPSDAKDQKILLEGQHISVDQDASLDIYDDANNHTGLNSNGDVETNIPNTFYDSLDTVKHIFIKKSASKVTAKIKSSKTIKANIKIRNYSQDSINKTTFYNNVPVDNNTTIQFTVDPSTSSAPTLALGTQIILASAEATGSAALDQTSPTTSIQISGTKDSSGIYSGPVTITLTGNDASSGILRIEYSLDNGVTVQTYTGPFTISTPGKTTIQIKSIDKLGNEEIPQTIIIEIAVPPSPTPTPSSSSTSGTSSSTSASNTSLGDNPTPGVGFDSPGVSKSTGNNTGILGINFENPSHVSDQINVSHVLDELKNPEIKKPNPAKQILGGLLMVSGGIVAIAGLGFAFTFLHPTPK